MEASEVKSTLSYNERRKILTQKKSQVVESKDGDKIMSTSEHSMTAEYTEEGIRLAHKDMTQQKAFLENKMKQLEPQFENEIELTEEEINLQKMLKRLQQFDTQQKAKTEYEAIKEEHKAVSKDLKELEDEIGTRLKF